jgi:hypothetical protein
MLTSSPVQATVKEEKILILLTFDFDLQSTKAETHFFNQNVLTNVFLFLKVFFKNYIQYKTEIPVYAVFKYIYRLFEFLYLCIQLSTASNFLKRYTFLVLMS